MKQEPRKEKVSLWTYPSLAKKLRKKAKREKRSVNDIINEVLVAIFED